ncbi:MAG: tRNA (adenosine(37)-N6)-threonylcarbamoyltransferase complex transferase subunit TsaD [Candidatus Andersenbacteria bacterium]
MNQKKDITLLAIETSCDETGVAVVRQEEHAVQVLGEAVASQIDIHKETGGVIPEVAAREHVRVIRPLIEKIMQESQVTGEDIDAIAVTVGPGLMPALSVGVQAARTLAYAWNKLIVPIHHLEGHVYSALLQKEENNRYTIVPDSFPALALIVSGGHTMLVHMPAHLQYRIIGTTRDDAVGEVFDKVARMLQLPYPGGPHVSRIAEEGDMTAYRLPRPMLDSHDLDFSYSGLKTAVLYAIRDMDPTTFEAQKPHLAASFEQAVVESLTAKVAMALTQNEYRTLLLAGGVAANARLRKELVNTASDHNVELRIAPITLCGDNATMIGLAAAFAYNAQRIQDWNKTDAMARTSLESFSVI